MDSDARFEDLPLKPRQTRENLYDFIFHNGISISVVSTLRLSILKSLSYHTYWWYIYYPAKPFLKSLSKSRSVSHYTRQSNDKKN